MELPFAELMQLVDARHHVVATIDRVAVANLRIGSSVETVLVFDLYEVRTNYRWRAAFPLSPTGRAELAAAVAQIPHLEPLEEP